MRHYVIGGGALTLLGSPHLTIDLDFVGDDVHPNELHRSIIQIAKELKIQVEPVPLDQFVPLPKGSEKRNIRIAQFGNLCCRPIQHGAQQTGSRLGHRF